MIRTACLALALAWTGASASAGATDAAPSLARAGHRVLSEDFRGLDLVARFPQARLSMRRAAAGSWSEATVEGAPSPQRLGEAILPEYVLLVALPAGTRPHLTLHSTIEEHLDGASPPGLLTREREGERVAIRPQRTADLHGRLEPVAVSVEPVGIVRHTNLARIVIRPVRYETAARRWIGMREARLRVDFDRLPDAASPGPAAGDLADDVDTEIATLVINPRAVSEALVGGTMGVGGATIPAPEPSLMAPLKVLVREDGLYRITAADLAAAGISSAGIDPDTFVLTTRGVEVPIEVTGAGDGSFDATDVIRFFGQAVGGEETWDNVYRLTGGVRDGLRMGLRDDTPGAHPVPAAFRNLRHTETNFLYWGSLPPGIVSPWYWDRVSVTTPGVPVFVDQTINLANVSTSPGTARLEVLVQSRRETPGPSPNHHARIYLNGHLVDDRTWTGLIGQTLAGDVPQAWILEGANTVRIENPADLGLTTQEEWFDWIRLYYDDRYVAEADYLEFHQATTGPFRFEVTGFGGSGMVVYDVANPSAPVRLTGIWSIQNGAVWTAAFSDAVNALPGRFVALRPGGERVPYGFVQDAPSNLRGQASTGADLLLVSHDGFHAAAERLATHRRDQGLRVVTARLTDVYDEFNGGIAEVGGIKNFVQWAFENYAAPAPSYLLLVGDGTFDPMDHKANGDNYIPAHFFQADVFGQAPSDTWYGAVSGTDEIPDLAVGRISVRSVAELDTYIDNVLDYENLPPVAALNSGVLYLADDDDPAFVAVLENLISSFQPPAMTSRRVYLSAYPQTTGGVASARADMRTAINTGSLLTSYMGHGGRTLWADEALWANGDVSTLSATGRLSFVLALNCVNGYFVNIDTEPYALGEAWNLIADRGAPGNWAPSATGTLFNYDTLSDEFFRHVFDLHETRLGRAAWRALVDAHLIGSVGLEYVQQMIYFGDPAALLPLDSDRDGRLDVDEIAASSNPEDGDSDDDGVTDGAEPSWNLDSDGDGRTNVADFDSDNDGLVDGLELGVVTPSPSTDTSKGHFTADAHPSTTTNPLAADTDGGGCPDGAEDRNANGQAGAGETDPTNPLDDSACSTTPAPEVQGLLVGKAGSDIVLIWNDLAPSDPCVLYRVYVATDAARPTAFSLFEFAGTATTASWTHTGAAVDGHGYHYLVTATTPAHGEGPLGHYGR